MFRPFKESAYWLVAVDLSVEAQLMADWSVDRLALECLYLACVYLALW